MFCLQWCRIDHQASLLRDQDLHQTKLTASSLVHSSIAPSLLLKNCSFLSCVVILIERKKIRLIWLSILAFHGRFEPWTPQLILLQRVINATVYAWPLTTKHGFSQSTRFKVPLFESTQSSDTVSRIPRFLRYAAVWIFYECSFVQEYTLFVMAVYFSRFCNLADWK